VIQRARQGGAVHVDNREPCALQPPSGALSERCDRGRVGRACVPSSACPPWGAQAECESSRGVQRTALGVKHRLSVARDSQRFPAAQYHLPLLWAVGSSGHGTADSRGPLWEVSGATGPCGESNGLDPRQPECEEHRKRGQALDPSGFEAGKQVKGKNRHV
jgi:hypothetical protein